MVTAEEEQKGKRGPWTRQLARAPLSPLRESILRQRVPHVKEKQLVSGNPRSHHLQETQDIPSSTGVHIPVTKGALQDP